MTRVALLAAAVLLAAGCSGQQPAKTAAQSCQQPPEAVLPDTAGSLTEQESGSYCLAVGDQLSVFLTGQQNRWAPVASSDPATLTAVRTSMVTAPVGVTPAMFRGKVAGTVRLSSQDGAGRTWQVTVVVR